MTAAVRELRYVLAVAAGAFLLHIAFDFLPVVFTLPALLAYTVAAPVAYLTVLAGMGELFSVQPAGVISLVIFVPYFLSRLFKRIQVDVTISFLFLVLLTVIGQFVMLFTPDMFRLLRETGASPFHFFEAAQVMPWSQAPWLVLPAAAVFGAAIYIRFNRR